ncbi:hypothetical protein, partial [Lentzea roselyniae]|uniref:WXG100-like domain-containing protein n=1 Tax=Lentzea roselyniae TaxID=531940 RepID=UPI0031FA1285
MTVPEELNWVFILLAGGSWPPGMEGDIWAIAEALEEAADEFDGVVHGLVVDLREVMNHVDETVGRAFWRYGEKLAEQPAFSAMGARDLAGIARGQSLNVQGAKLSMITQLVFAAQEIMSMWVNPVMWPLIGPFVGMMQGIVKVIFARLTQWMARAMQILVHKGASFVGKSVGVASVENVTT